jgi:hypothetical protein
LHAFAADGTASNAARMTCQIALGVASQHLTGLSALLSDEHLLSMVFGTFITILDVRFNVFSGY